MVGTGFWIIGRVEHGDEDIQVVKGRIKGNRMSRIEHLTVEEFRLSNLKP